MNSIACTPPLQQWSLHCPQIPFQNRFGFTSAFREMNPAMFYDVVKEEWIVLVRGVNYEKQSNNTFVVLEHPSKSIYWIAHGPSLEKLEFVELQCEYGLPTYPSYWNGIEDARFIDSRRILVTVPELDSGGKPTIFHATLNDSLTKLSNFQRCEPSNTPEKNWMPMPGGTHVIYSICPLQFKPYDTDKDMFTFPLNTSQKELLEGFHGSTNGVLWKTENGLEGQLYLIYKTIETERGPYTTSGDAPKRVVHRWFFLGVKGELLVSQPFTLFKHSYIEFPCSLVKKENQLFVSLGINDSHAAICQVQSPLFVSI